MFNCIRLLGMVTSEPIKREVNGRPVVLFHLTTTEPALPPHRPDKVVLSHTIVVWDGLAEMFLYSYGLGNVVMIEGRISYRTGPSGFKCEIVASQVEGLDRMKDGKRVKNTSNAPAVESAAISAQYPAVSPNAARVAAETLGEGDAGFDRVVADYNAANDVAANGSPF